MGRLVGGVVDTLVGAVVVTLCSSPGCNNGAACAGFRVVKFATFPP
jgi:hypothetical protein